MNYTTPPFQAIHFLPARAEPSTRLLPLLAIHLVAHAPLPDGANHWCFYLQSSPISSIALDMTPTHTIPSTVLPDGSKGNLLLSELEAVYPAEATKAVRLSVREGLTVGGLLDVLVREGRGRYEFNDKGRGCRMWTSEVVLLLERLGVVVDAGEAGEAREAIEREYPSGNPFPLDLGAYY